VINEAGEIFYPGGRRGRRGPCLPARSSLLLLSGDQDALVLGAGWPLGTAAF